jgi:hypothetical protein
MSEGIGKFEFGKKKEVSSFAYFLAFAFWMPLVVTAVRFWWDFFNWLFV